MKAKVMAWLLTWFIFAQSTFISYHTEAFVKTEVGCTVYQEKNRTNILLHITKVIAPTVKTQAGGQNNLSRALKWGIVCLCSFNSFEVTIKYVHKLGFQIPQFCKKVTKSLCKIAKNGKVQRITLFVFYHNSNSN